MADQPGHISFTGDGPDAGLFPSTESYYTTQSGRTPSFFDSITSTYPVGSIMELLPLLVYTFVVLGARRKLRGLPLFPSPSVSKDEG